MGQQEVEAGWRQSWSPATTSRQQDKKGSLVVGNADCSASSPQQDAAAVFSATQRQIFRFSNEVVKGLSQLRMVKCCEAADQEQRRLLDDKAGAVT